MMDLDNNMIFDMHTYFQDLFKKMVEGMKREAMLMALNSPPMVMVIRI